MAFLIINGTKEILGKVTAKNVLTRDDEGNEAVTGCGTLATHEYIRDIDTIKTDRFELTNVNVVEEVFGSDDFDIVFNFTCDEVKIDAGSPFPKALIQKMWDKQYGEVGYAKDSEIEEVISQYFKDNSDKSKEE